jgi:hypothetical protein
MYAPDPEPTTWVEESVPCEKWASVSLVIDDVAVANI